MWGVRFWESDVWYAQKRATNGKRVVKPYSDKEFEIATINFLIGTDKPFNLLKRAPFRDFVFMLKGDAKLIGPKTAKVRTLDSSVQLLDKTIERIGDSRFSVSCDVWSAPGMTASYMSVVVHYINSKWEYQESLVGFE